MVPAAVQQFIAIVLGTLVSEDLTAVTTGLLIAASRVDPMLGMAACGFGIWIGDLGLWALGHLARRGRLGRYGIVPGLDRERWMHLRRSVELRPGRLILASRFLPGTRLPLYLMASTLGLSARRFALWTLVSVLLWVPTLVVAAAVFGDAVVTPLERWFGAGWLVAPLVILWSCRRLIRTSTSSAPGPPSYGFRERLSIRFARARRWEFWPPWLFYAPVGVWVAGLAMRYGMHALTAANPGIEDGGFVGESKSAILGKLPERWAIPWARLESGVLEDRVDLLRRVMRSQDWSFPVVLKPDVGQRGVGVRLVRSEEEARGYLAVHRAPVLAQRYHPGPYEAGVFYYRLPNEPSGRIFSITDKRFPAVVGDGTLSLEALILKHPRYRLQAATFFARHRQRGWVPRAGERFQLAHTGNHAQGTLFLDGAFLWTPALERRVDEIARAIDGFYIGRFDVRYADPEAFGAGDDFAIVELNGVTAEATHIYDPSISLRHAYRTLFEQWALVFRIGAMNLERGSRATPMGRVARLCAAHLTSRPALPIAD